MGSEDDVSRERAFVFINFLVALFSIASLCINLYIIVEAFELLKAFFNLSGYGSKNWDWTVVTLVLAFAGVPANCSVIAYTYRSRNSKFRHHVMLGLSLSSAVNLSITTPTLHVVRQHRWAEVLRKAGHADHAYHVNVFYMLEEIVVIVWSALGFVCFAAFLHAFTSALLRGQSLRSFWDESNQPKKHRSQLQPGCDVERGEDAENDRRLRGEPGPLNQHPVFAEGEQVASYHSSFRLT